MENLFVIGLSVLGGVLVFLFIDWITLKKNKRLYLIQIDDFSQKVKKLEDDNNTILNNYELAKQKVQFLSDEKTHLSKENETLKQQYQEIIEREKILNNQIIELKGNNQKLADENNSLVKESELNRQKNQFLLEEKNQISKDYDNLKQQISTLREKEKENTISIAKYESQIDNLRAQVSKESNRLPDILIEQNENLKQVFVVITKLQQDIINAKQQTIDAHTSKGILETIGKGLDKATDKIRNFLGV